jgi:hypothetical protein
MSARQPTWLYLHEALDRVSQRMFQEPMELLRTSQSLKVRYTLRDLLRGGNIEAYVRVKNRMVRLTVPLMLRSPFGIHYKGTIPGIEIGQWPDQLLSLQLKATDLESSLDSRFPRTVQQTRPKSPAQKNEEAQRCLVKLMKGNVRLTKKYCQTKMLVKFEISRKAFLDIWPKAQKEAGVNWSRPGKFKTV